MTNETEIAASIIQDVANADRLWPREKRIIYCSVSGRPWGTVDDAYVEYFIKNFGIREEAKMEDIINRMTLFNGPSPLWQSKVPNMLLLNQHIDPCGFTVYLLNTVLKLESAVRSNLDLAVAWRREMAQLYEALKKLRPEIIRDTNQTILMMTGEGLLPHPSYLPSRDLLPYGQEETLANLMDVCKKYYKRYRFRYNTMSTYTKQTPHLIHRRTMITSFNAEKADVETQRKLFDLMMMSMFSDLDLDTTKAERDVAKEKTGIPSPMLLALKETEEHLRRNPILLQKTKATTVQPGQKVVLNFGMKKGN